MSAKLEEEASLYVLDLMDAAERRDFEEKLSLAPELQKCVREMEDTVASVALTAPHCSVPSGNLEAIQGRVNAPAAARVSRVFGLGATYGGWAAAACLAIGCGWLWMSKNDTEQRLADLQKGELEVVEIVNLLKEQMAKGETGAPELAADGAQLSAADRLYKQLMSTKLVNPKLYEREGVERLRTKLGALTAKDRARYQGGPDVAAPRIMRLRPPGEAPEEDEGLFLAATVRQLIDTGLETASQDPEPRQTNIRSSRDGEELIFDSGTIPPLGLLNFQPGDHATYRNFPAESAEEQGLIPLQDGSFYDELSEVVFQPRADGTTYDIRRADFDRENLAAHVIAPPEPEAAPEPEAPTPVVEQPSEILAYFEETIGKGFLSIENLPLPSEDSIYQVWFEQPGVDDPVSFVRLEHFEGEGDRIFGKLPFELPEGVSPSAYFVTEEPVGGSDHPSDNVVLQGPGK